MSTWPVSTPLRARDHKIQIGMVFAVTQPSHALLAGWKKPSLGSVKQA